jgi:hypothetical protein
MTTAENLSVMAARSPLEDSVVQFERLHLSLATCKQADQTRTTFDSSRPRKAAAASATPRASRGTTNSCRPLKRPDPFPAVFGYHEIFHALVVIACSFNYAAIAMLLV